MQKKKHSKKLAAALIILLAAAIAAGAIYMTHKGKETPQGSITPVEIEEVMQTLRDTAWIERQGEYVDVYMFCMEDDCWHGQSAYGAIKGSWGVYQITGNESFIVNAQTGDSYCDFAGEHSYRIAEDEKTISIDGVTYERADIDEWLGEAIGDDIPEDAIVVEEEE